MYKRIAFGELRRLNVHQASRLVSENPIFITVEGEVLYVIGKLRDVVITTGMSPAMVTKFKNLEVIARGGEQNYLERVVASDLEKETSRSVVEEQDVPITSGNMDVPIPFQLPMGV